MTRLFEAEVNLMLSLNLIIINLVAVHHRMRSCGTDAGDFYISATSGPGVGGWRRCRGWQRAVTLSAFPSVLGETNIWSFTVACDLKRRCVVFPSCFHLLSLFSHSLTCIGGNSHQASHQICLILPKSCKAHGVNGFCSFLPITSPRIIGEGFFYPEKLHSAAWKQFHNWK